MLGKMREKIRAFFYTKPGQQLEPRKFTIAVTSGLPSVDRATVVQELQQSMGKGMDMMRLDVESINHISPEEVDELKNISKSQGVKWSIHGDLTIDPTRADKVSWDLCARAFEGYVKLAKSIEAEYVNFHASVHSAPFLVDSLSGHPPLCAGPDGKPISDWARKSERALKYNVFDAMGNRRRPDTEFLQARGAEVISKSGKSGEELAKSLQNPNELYQTGLSEYMKLAKEGKIDIGNEMYEWDAYIIIAFVMYANKDSLWSSLAEGKNPEKLLNEEGGQMKLTNAVAAKYLEEHIKKILPELQKTKIIFTFENPDARGGAHKGEKLHRLMLPSEIYHVIKKINHPQIKLCIDWEHIAFQGFNPWEEVKKFPSDMGAFTIAFDMNSHPNVNHLQHPVERGDKKLYELMWEMKKRGLEGAYLTYEWGGGRQGGEKWGESSSNLKMIAKMLEDNVSPDQLPPEFFGMNPAEIALEKANMRKNMFKPLEGSLDFPEVDSGWIGRSVIQKGQLEKYRKEEFK